MLQQINFLDGLQTQSPYFLSDRRLFAVTGIFLIFLMIITVVQSILLSNQKHEISELQKIYANQQIILTQNTLLAQRNNTQDIEKKISDKKSLLEALQSKESDVDPCTLLSYYFETFSKVVFPGLWLTSIDINLNNNLITLTGLSSASLLPIKFIQSIQKTACFSQQQFSVIDVSRQTSPESAPDISANLPDKTQQKTPPVLLVFTLKSSPKSSAKSALGEH